VRQLTEARDSLEARLLQLGNEKKAIVVNLESEIDALKATRATLEE
jgi:hypothetical protein